MSHEARSRGARRVLPLGEQHLAQLPQLSGCVAWQVDAVRRGRLIGDRRQAAKAEWLREVEAAWGHAGHVVVMDGTPVAAVVAAPSAWLPGTADLPTAPVSPDAIVIAGLWVDPRHRGSGLARLLVQRTAAYAVAHHTTDPDAASAPIALEAFGDTRGGRGCEGGAHCVLPVELWERLGFAVHRAHPLMPRLRMDLRTTVGWRQATGQAWGRLRDVIRTRPVPAPEARDTGRRVPVGLR